MALHQYRRSLSPSLLGNLQDNTQTKLKKARKRKRKIVFPDVTHCLHCYSMYLARLHTGCARSMEQVSVSVPPWRCWTQPRCHCQPLCLSEEQTPLRSSAKTATTGKHSFIHVCDGRERDAGASPCKEPWEELRQYWKWSAHPQTVVAVPGYSLIPVVKVDWYQALSTTHLQDTINQKLFSMMWKTETVTTHQLSMTILFKDVRVEEFIWRQC